MSATQIFADDIAALMPDRRIARLRDDEDVADLAALLAHAFGVGAMQTAIRAALTRRRRELAVSTSSETDEARDLVIYGWTILMMDGEKITRLPPHDFLNEKHGGRDRLEQPRPGNCTLWPVCGCGTQSGPHSCEGRIP